MYSPQRPAPRDATASSKPHTPFLRRSRTLTFDIARIGANFSPPTIPAPVPRRAANDTILPSDTYDDRQCSIPPHCSPNTFQWQLSLNVNAQNGPPPVGDIRAPHQHHSRTSSRASAKSSPSPSSKKSPHSSPDVIAMSPNQIPSPSLRSAMRQTPSPAQDSPQGRYPTLSPASGSGPRINIVEATPPTPTPTSGAKWSPVQPSNHAGRSRVDSSGESATPGQPMSPSRSPQPRNLLIGTPPVRHRSPSESGRDGGGYSSPSILAKSPPRIPPAQFQNPSQGASDAVLHQNQTGMMSPTNQRQPASPPQTNQSADQQRSSGSGTSWQAPSIPGDRSPSVGTPRSHTNPISFLDPGRSTHATPTSARPASRLSNQSLSRIRTSSGHPVGGQPDGRPRSSQSRSSQRTAPHSPAWTTSTRVDGNGNDVNINSVVDNLMRVPPTSVTWKTRAGVLTLTNDAGER